MGGRFIFVAFIVSAVITAVSVSAVPVARRSFAVLKAERASRLQTRTSVDEPITFDFGVAGVRLRACQHRPHQLVLCDCLVAVQKRPEAYYLSVPFSLPACDAKSMEVE
jgi:hypothetical protein